MHKLVAKVYEKRDEIGIALVVPVDHEHVFANAL